jgi:hypothetical protein
VSHVAYAFAYVRITALRGADFVVVLVVSGGKGPDEPDEQVSEAEEMAAT